MSYIASLRYAPHRVLTQVSQIDHHKLAEKLGMSNDRSASNAIGALRKKIAAFDGTVLTPTKTGRNAKASDGDNNTPGKDAASNTKKSGRKGKNGGNNNSINPPSKRKAESTANYDIMDTPTKKVKGEPEADSEHEPDA